MTETESSTQASASQHARFVETARALGCDEDEAAFDKKMKAVVGPKSDGDQHPKTSAPPTNER